MKMKDKSKFCDTLIQKRLLMMDLSAVNCFCEQLYEHYFSTDGWLPFQYKLWLMGLILRGEKGSRIILNLGEGVLISIVRYSIPKLELRDTTLILSWVIENCPAPILTSCCWTCPTIGCRRKYLCSKTIVLILRLLSFMHKKSSGDSRNFWNCFWGLR